MKLNEKRNAKKMKKTKRRRRKKKKRSEGNRAKNIKRVSRNTRERGGYNTRGSTCVLLSIIYRSCSLKCRNATLRNHYVAVCFRPLKNPPCREAVRCFFLDGKCRRHKCLFDLMTRCPTRPRSGTHTREESAPFAHLEVLSNFRSVPSGIRARF